MKRTALALLAASALAATASAQLGSDLPECERNYRGMWHGVLPAVAKDLTGGQLAELHRYALRAYDGCTSGDERAFAQAFFNQLASVANADQWLRDLAKSLPAK
jgi:hypothetical protein